MTARTVIEFAVANADIINSNSRDHFHTVAAKARKGRKTAADEAQAQGFIPMDAAVLLVEVGWQPLKRRRDAHNVSTKHWIDGFIDAGVLPDDSDDHLLAKTVTTYDRHESGMTWLRFSFTPVEVAA